MADHVFGMIPTLAHCLDGPWRDQRALRCELCEYAGEMQEVGGRTLGISGLGDIGLAVAQRTQRFGMVVYAVTRRSRPAHPTAREV